MEIQEFTLVLEAPKGMNTNLEDALFEAGCDDALLSYRGGIAYLDFDREAENLETAIILAIDQVESVGLGLKVKRVEPSDLVTSAEIARRLNRSRQSIQQLISGSRGVADFPLPIAGVTSKTMLWSWQEVAKWFLDKGKLEDENVYLKAMTMKQINESLEMRQSESQLKNIRRITKILSKRRGGYSGQADPPFRSKVTPMGMAVISSRL